MVTPPRRPLDLPGETWFTTEAPQARGFAAGPFVWHETGGVQLDVWFTPRRFYGVFAAADGSREERVAGHWGLREGRLLCDAGHYHGGIRLLPDLAAGGWRVESAWGRARRLDWSPFTISFALIDAAGIYHPARPLEEQGDTV